MPVIIPCAVVSAYDADTIACASGIKIRLAGVDANEMRGKPCRAECAAMPAVEARDYVRRITFGKTLQCTPIGRSYNRIVASCRFSSGVELGCLLLSKGAAVRVIRYRMPSCD